MPELSPSIRVSCFVKIGKSAPDIDGQLATTSGLIYFTHDDSF